ncbi:MAG: DUF3516 domain-containing protein [Microthrixaceae bacterium]|nr:DUF3516 domain-containing protein [Microthrixaceae bacterium]
MNLGDRLGDKPGVDAAVDLFLEWAADLNLELYPHQEEALLAVASGDHVIVNTPTGSGKSLIAAAAHTVAMARGERSFYTAPIKALVSEKFFELSRTFGPARVGMLTGDAAVNHEAPIICCTAEVLANMALREGNRADVGQVVMDEFHFIADPDRGWAWQVPLLELNRAQQILLSATLGDTTRFEVDLFRRSARPVTVVRSATRPVPLHHEFRMDPLPEVLDELLATDQAPIYLVHFTQAGAIDQAQSLMSLKLATREEKEAIAAEIGAFRFSAGFGKVLSRFVRNGIGVHHAGMLPRYRRLVERLAQAGLLKVICGTDTLGVGINVPIRTVVLTSLSKFDGTQVRLLSAREFHQISGRAGRAGFDTSGRVVVMAPQHVIDNARSAAKALAKAGGDPTKVRRQPKKKPPEGTVSWAEPTFTRLVGAAPEPLGAPLTVTHSMVLNVLDRPGDGRGALHQLLSDNHDTETNRARHLVRAAEIEQALVDGGIVEELADPDDRGRTVRVTIDLQADFALNQPLAPFALAALDLLDPESPTWALDVVSVIEAVLEDPRPVISSQVSKARGEAVSRMKADGLDYDQRMAELESVTHPRPLAELLEPMFEVYRGRHPWVAESPLSPKAVVREMWERAMGFADYVRFHQIARAEGALLRYLTDAYRTLVKTVPEDTKTDELVDLTEWLGELVRQVDSSLLDEWEALSHPPDGVELTPPVDHVPPPLTANRRAFAVLVRNAMFQRVELAALRRWDALGDLDGDEGWTPQRWSEALAPFSAEHSSIGIDADARNPVHLAITEQPGIWLLRQTLCDPDGDHDWALVATVDLARSDEEGEAVIAMVSVDRLTD